MDMTAAPEQEKKSFELIDGSHKYTDVFVDAAYKNIGNGHTTYEIRNKHTGEAMGFCLFQDGPISEGINGIMDENLLAIVIDRLRGFQEGPFMCRENAIALTHFETGLMWLKERTQGRTKRGVEGTHKV